MSSDVHLRNDRVPPAPPLLPALAAKAARDLSRPLKSLGDSVRAIEAWFAVNGDPFAAVPSATWAHRAQSARDGETTRVIALSLGDLVAAALASADELRQRLTTAAGREDL